MAATQYLIDTNAGIDYLGENMPKEGMSLLDRVIDGGYNISVISRIELYAYSKLSDQDIATLDIFTGQSNVININDDIIDKTIKLRKAHKTKLPDAIIVATALSYGLTLVTRNNKDFKNIPGLKMTNPYEL